MTSAAKIAANRRNARKSTGPRSQAGKMRSRRNAFRHGLAIPIRIDIAFSDQIEPLTDALVEDVSQPGQRQTARMAALAQLELIRAQAVKVQMINRAVQQLQEQGSDDSNEFPVLAYASQIKRLAKLERYESRALSQRNRALRALGQGGKREVNVFVEPVIKLEVTALVKAALAHPPQVRYSQLIGWSGESYCNTLDLSDGEVLRVFIQCGESGTGRMYIDMSRKSSISQTFAIAKMHASFGGGKWIAICPTSGLAVADLYVRADTHEVKSRHALNLHYRSQRARRQS